ncbi:MAG: ADP-ribosylglycohydrolase family protein [Opitutales bacterium]
MNDRLQNALLGALVADAVAMPVHWYYDTAAMDRDYGPLKGYAAPRNPHPDSILWRSHYQARNKQADILHDQARYWGQRQVHYHQFLPAGDNTINFLLGVQLYRSTVRAGRYDPDRWLETYIALMRKPGWHRDTYLEEYHRAFFDNWASGKPPAQCGIKDIHIGGLAQVPFLIAALDALGPMDTEAWVATVRQHVGLTHRGAAVARAAETLTRLLLRIAQGLDVPSALDEQAGDWITPARLDTWSAFDDRRVVGQQLTMACYLPESFTAALYIAHKYAGDFSAGVLANARCGGDNCHRGAVVGSLLGAANPIPEAWLTGLHSMERLRCDTLDALFN